MNLDQARPITGRHVLLAMVGFFVVVMAANAVFIFLALDSWTGLSKDDAYQSGLAYNQTLAAGAQQRSLGWRPEIRYEDMGDGQGRLTLTMLDSDGAPIHDLAVEATVRRPAEDEYDQTLALPPITGGSYRAELRLPLAGQWDVAVTATLPSGAVYRIEDRLWLR